MFHFCLATALSILASDASDSTDWYESAPPAPTLTGLLLPGTPIEPALADDEGAFSYSYVEAGFSKTEVDEFDEDSDAVYARVSLELFRIFHVFLDYSAQSLDDVSFGGSSDDVDADLYGLGFGAHFTVMPKLDLLGEASWIYSDLSSDDIDELDETDNGFTLYGGARWMVLDWEGGGLEALGGYRWIDSKSVLSDDEVNSIEIGARAHFLRAFSVGAKYSYLEDDDRIGFDARFSW